MSEDDDANVPFDPTATEFDIDDVNLDNDQILNLIKFLADEVLSLRKMMEEKVGGVAS